MEEEDLTFDTFKLPEGMTREAGFKVLSYLTDYIEKSPRIEIGSNSSVNVLNNVLNLKNLGFRKVDINLDENTDNMINLFTVGGRALLFKYSEYYQKYIEWYTEGITLEEIKDIYKKIGIEFYNLIKK